MPSLIAAFQLGLREHLGGTPDHLAVEQVVDPFLSDGSDNRDALLVHDMVPGGTGYLAELADPQKLWSVLRRAWLVVRDCPCQDEDRAACHRCLSPWINGADRSVGLAARPRSATCTTSSPRRGAARAGRGARLDVVAQASAADDPETHIEQRFRAVLRTRLTEGLGASVTEQPGPQGNRWTIVLAGRTWTLEPQLLLGTVKPDFVLACNDPGVPRVAIFCDGWRFHASPAVNRLADDAAKRAALRAQGLVVVSLTWQDLDAAEQQVPTPPAVVRRRSVEQGPRGEQRSACARRTASWSPAGRSTSSSSWVAAPDPAGLRALAEHLPLLLIGAGAAGKIDPSEPLRRARSLLHMRDRRCRATGRRPPWSWRHDTLTVVARRTAGTASEVAVLLDDRGDHLGQAHKPAWNEWLRLANLLNLRLQESTVLTIYQLTRPSRHRRGSSVDPRGRRLRDVRGALGEPARAGGR